MTEHRVYTGRHINNEPFGKCLCGAVLEGRAAIDGHTGTSPDPVKDATCSIEMCGNPVRAWGWCKRHYNAWYRNGDPRTISKQKSRA